jgi:hypothetical protein
VPLANIAKLLADDRKGYVPPTTLTPPAAATDTDEKRSLLTKSTVNAYITAVLELWRL